MSNRRYAVCYFCGINVDDDHYCYGCHHYVCPECHQTDLIGQAHDVEDHESKLKYWLISDETFQKVKDVLERLAIPGQDWEFGIIFDRRRFIKALHELETGVHRTDVVPDDEISEEDFNEVFESLEL